MLPSLTANTQKLATPHGSRHPALPEVARLTPAPRFDEWPPETMIALIVEHIRQPLADRVRRRARRTRSGRDGHWPRQDVRARYQAFSRTTATLMNLCLLLSPLVAVLMGAALIAGEQDRGTLEHLLAQPITRTGLLLAKHAGLVIALTAAALAGFLPAGVLIASATEVSACADRGPRSRSSRCGGRSPCPIGS